MKDLDPKSLIIGFLAASVVALVVALIGATKGTKGNEVGRYVHHPRSPTIILDTVSGDLYVTTADVLSLESTQPVWYKILTIKSKAAQHDDEGK